MLFRSPFAVPGSTWLHLSLREAAHRVPLVESLVVRHDTVALMALAALALLEMRRVEAGGAALLVLPSAGANRHAATGPA